MSRPPSRVLVVRLSSIGDVIHSIPAYMALRRAWPEAGFGWVVEPPTLELVERLPGLDWVHPVDTAAVRRAPWSAPGRMLELRRRLRRVEYELAVDLQGLLKSAVVARLSGARVAGYGPSDAREPLACRLYHERAAPAPPGCHILERNLHLARTLTGRDDLEIDYPRLCDDDDHAVVDRALRDAGIHEPVALLHTTANWPSKRIGADKWIHVGREIFRRSGLPVLWVWGPGEARRVEEMAAAAGEGNFPAPRTSLSQLAALLERTRLFVGGDSAPLHLAVACGAPVVGVFGPTDPARLGPRDPADEVVRRVLPCSHCHERHCPLGTRECLEDLPPESIVTAAVDRLGRASSRNEPDPCV